MLYTVNDFIQANNAVLNDKIHDFNVKRKSESEIWLYIDFGNADPVVLQHFFEYIDGKYDIKRIDLGQMMQINSIYYSLMDNYILDFYNIADICRRKGETLHAIHTLQRLNSGH